MCKLCNIKPVYEFTNKRKLCKRCFINYFQKKVLYTIRKFKMIRRGDKVQYKKTREFKGVVLDDILKFVLDKFDFYLTDSNKFLAKRDKFKSVRIASASSLDSEAENIIKILINGNVSELKKNLPSYENAVKPLCLFLDEEILLYAKLKNLKFRKAQEKKDKIRNFEDEFEKKHPEVKRAIVNSVLKLYNQE